MSKMPARFRTLTRWARRLVAARRLEERVNRNPVEMEGLEARQMMCSQPIFTLWPDPTPCPDPTPVLPMPPSYPMPLPTPVPAPQPNPITPEQILIICIITGVCGGGNETKPANPPANPSPSPSPSPTSPSTPSTGNGSGNANNAAPASAASGGGGASAAVGQLVPVKIEPADYLIETGKTNFMVDDVKVTVTLKGPGMGLVSVREDGIVDILLTGTTAKSSASIKTVGGDLEVNTLLIDSPIKSFTGKTTDLIGAGVFLASVGSVTLDDVLAGAQMQFNGKPTDKPMNLKFDRVADTYLLSDAPIKSLQATEWRDFGAESEFVTAPSMGKLTIKGNKKAGVAGHFEPRLYITGEDGSTRVLGSAKVAGNVSKGLWLLQGDAGTISFSGDTQDWTFYGDNVKRFNVKGLMRNSRIVAAGEVGGNAMDRIV